MGVRNKINGMFGMGIFLFASFFGVAFQSWAVFLVLAAVLVGFCMFSGDIRFEPTETKHRRRK